MNLKIGQEGETYKIFDKCGDVFLALFINGAIDGFTDFNPDDHYKNGNIYMLTLEQHIIRGFITYNINPDKNVSVKKV